MKTNKQRDWRTPFKSRRKWTAERIFLRVIFGLVGCAALAFAAGLWHNYRPLDAVVVAVVGCLFFTLDPETPANETK